MLRINEVLISNIKGIESLRFSLGTVTRLRGRNETGKSSVIESVRTVFAGGLNQDHLRRGSDKGLIRLVLSDSTVIEKSIYHERGTNKIVAKVLITAPDGTIVPAPQTFIESLAESMAVDPAEILRLDVTKADGRKKLIEVLLRVLPVAFTPEEILSVCRTSAGEMVLTDRERPKKPLNLIELRRLRGVVEESRRRIGIEAEQAEGAVVSLTKSLPPDTGEDWSATCASLQANWDAAVKEFNDTQALVIQSAAEEERAIYAKYSAQQAEVAREIDAQIAELQKKIDELKRLKTARANHLHADQLAELTALNERKDQTLAQNDASARPVLDELRTEMGNARAQADAQQRAAGIRESITTFSAKAAAGKERYAAYSHVLLHLDQLKKDKLDTLPVPGLEFGDDEVTYQGVPWAEVNTAGKVTVAVALAAEKSHGTLGFMVLDDAEHLDRETLTALESALVEAGFQLLTAEVDRDVAVPAGSPFLIETR